MDFGWSQSIDIETKVSQNVKISLFPKFQPYSPSGLAISFDGLIKNNICLGLHPCLLVSHRCNLSYSCLRLFQCYIKFSIFFSSKFCGGLLHPLSVRKSQVYPQLHFCLQQKNEVGTFTWAFSFALNFSPCTFCLTSVVIFYTIC